MPRIGPITSREPFNAFVHLEVDRRIKVYYRHNVKDECGLTGELVSIVGHKPHQNFAWNCERCEERCDKCNNIIH